MTVSSIGQIIGQQQIEMAYIEILKTWFVVYLDEVEAQNNLKSGSIPRPVDTTGFVSFYGSATSENDELAWSEDELPVVIVIAEPDEETIRLATAYQQWYTVQVKAISVATDENSARVIASLYGAAAEAALGQDVTSIGGLCSNTILTGGPAPSLLDPDRREFAVSTVTFRSLACNVLTHAGRPADPTWPPPATPTVGSASVTTDFVAADQPLPDPD
jgi:hypothetical protein